MTPAGTQGLHRCLNELQCLRRPIERDQQTIAKGFDQQPPVALHRITNQGKVLLDPLDGNQFISKDLERRIDHITEDDGAQLAGLFRHQRLSSLAGEATFFAPYTV